jgi:hypothetical protein
MTYIQTPYEADIDVESWVAAISDSQSRLVELFQFVLFIANIQNNGLQD